MKLTSLSRRRFLATASAAAFAHRPATAAADPAPLFSFGLITDAQYADAEPKGDRHYRATPDKLKRAVDVLAGRKLPFTLHLGDFIDRDFKSFDVLLPILDGLGHPVHHLLGNHDYDVADADKPLVAAKLGMPGDYYSFAHAGVRFVMLDTNDISTYKHPPGPATAAAEAQLAQYQQDKQPGAKPFNGALGKDQLAWLETTLDTTTTAVERVIVCGHHPVLPAAPHNLWNPGDLIAAITRRPSVAAYFCGHNHAGDYAEHQGRHFVTFRSILHTPDQTAFSIIHLHPDRIVIEAHGREVARELPLP